jgi:cytidylate kinase
MESNHIIINVGRQVCAGGLEIGRLLADEFHAKYYDRELLNLAARESGFSEEFFKRSDERKGFFRSFFNLQRGSSIGSDHFYQSNFSQESLFKFQSDAIIKAAQESSCVFVGRCADYVLRERKNVVSVFVTASMDFRIQQIMTKQDLDRPQARKFIEQREAKRAAYYNYYTGKKWGAAESYDLCIDTSVLGLQATEQLIAYFIRKRFEL